MDAVDYLIDQGFVDESRMGFRGASYGGYMTNWVITHTDRFKAAVSEAGISDLESYYDYHVQTFGVRGLTWEFCGSPEENPDFYEKCSPINFAENVTTATLFIHGKNDIAVPIEQAEEMAIVIIENTDTSVAFIRYPDEEHGIGLKGKNYLDRTYRMINWFDSYLKV